MNGNRIIDEFTNSSDARKRWRLRHPEHQKAIIKKNCARYYLKKKEKDKVIKIKMYHPKSKKMEIIKIKKQKSKKIIEKVTIKETTSNPIYLESPCYICINPIGIKDWFGSDENGFFHRFCFAEKFRTIYKNDI